MPDAAASAAARVADGGAAVGLDRARAMPRGGILPQHRSASTGSATRCTRARRCSRSRSADELYGGMVSQWRDPAVGRVGATEPPSQATGAAPALHGLGTVERMMALDMHRLSARRHTGEGRPRGDGGLAGNRVPLLDHDVVEFAWRLPLDLKIRDGETKWILRQLLYRHVPRELIERPKMGFGVPIDDWLRGPLRDWAEALLDERRLREEGYFRPEPIRADVGSASGGRRNEQYRLWGVLMFQSWLEAQGGASEHRVRHSRRRRRCDEGRADRADGPSAPHAPLAAPTQPQEDCRGAALIGLLMVVAKLFVAAREMAIAWRYGIGDWSMPISWR